MSIQVRRQGEVFYVARRCLEPGCLLVIRSRYFQEKAEAQAYADAAPRRGARARCLTHAAEFLAQHASAGGRHG